MVSLWPWKGDENSPAAFEKTLSTLATKITKSQAQLDSLRSKGRRYKALWTLYTTFAYMLCMIIMLFAVGWKNGGIYEYTGLAGSPVLIYIVRQGITQYYNYRVDTIAARLEDQQGERTKTIEKLKAATKYNSTQELLEKYGGAPPKPKKSAAPKTPKPDQKKSQPSRLPSGPPPTANVPRPGQVPNQPSPPPQQPMQHMTPVQHIQQLIPATPQLQSGQAEFAPNAFSAPPQYAQNAEFNPGGNWYDRILDLLLGEDETAPKNRVALICQNCRLVNGQAPPGTKSLAALGKWRCFGCGTLNGEEDEAVKVVQEMKERIEEEKPQSGIEKKALEDSTGGESADTKDAPADDEAEYTESAEETIEAKPKKDRLKSSKKKT